MEFKEKIYNFREEIKINFKTSNYLTWDCDGYNANNMSEFEWNKTLLKKINDSRFLIDIKEVYKNKNIYKKNVIFEKSKPFDCLYASPEVSNIIRHGSLDCEFDYEINFDMHVLSITKVGSIKRLKLWTDLYLPVECGILCYENSLLDNSKLIKNYSIIKLKNYKPF